MSVDVTQMARARGVNITYRRYEERVSKKALVQEHALVAHHGTPWHHVFDSKKSYVPTALPDTGWDFATLDWEDRILRGRPMVVTKRYPLNHELADRAIKAFRMLKLADVVGTPALDEAGERWFRDVVRLVFGSYDPVRKIRMIRELFLLVPKKNSKTTYGALLMLLVLIFNERPRGQAIMVAPIKDVAGIAYDAIAGAIALDPVLTARFRVRDDRKTIIDRKNGAELMVMTFDPSALTGQKVFAALIDELHVMMKMAKAASAIRQIRGGMLPFPESILIMITTQSEEAPTGVFKAELDNARDVRDGKRLGTRLFPILYEFPQSMQKDINQPWKDPKNWHLVTPNLGKSIALNDLIAAYNDAASKGEGELRSWASQHLNIEIGIALRANSWAGAVVYDKLVPDPKITVEHILKVCEVVEIGVDGGGLDDLLAMNITGRERDSGCWLSWVHAWAHPIVLERRKSELQRLEEFRELGELSIIENMGEDVDQLVDLVVQCYKSGLLDKVGLDPHGVASIMDALIEEKIPEEHFLGISQGWRLSGAIMTLEREMATGRFKPAAQKIMAWAVSNAKVEPRGNAKLITKQASGFAKIDPLMATLNAIHIMSSNPAARSKKYQMLVLGGASRGGASAHTRN